MSNDTYMHQNTWMQQVEKKVLEQMQKDAEELMYPKKDTCETVKLLGYTKKKKDVDKTI